MQLSPIDARKLLLQSQRLYSRRNFGGGAAATLSAIEHLGYVQLDTLSVVARAHLHTLWNRVETFKPAHIDQLQEDRKIYEHWAHALSILPMRDYRFSLPMMKRIASGDVHWYPKNKINTQTVLNRIKEEGPLSAKDFDDKPSSKEMWARAPSKLALEQLFMEGELMIPRRNKFHKVYDLRERVLPDDIDTREPDSEEYCRHLTRSFLRAQGIGQAKEFYYLRKGLGPSMNKVLGDMEEEGLVFPVTVSGKNYYIDAAAMELLDAKSPPAKVRILNPFDNAVIQRKRIAELFKFDFQIECYVPKEKRVFGYFCLPILQGNKLVARLDAKASRKDRIFHIYHLNLEKSVKNPDRFYQALLPELQRFMKFNECDTVEVHKITGSDSKPSWLD